MGTAIVGVILLGIVGLAVRSMVRDKKNGKSIQCGGDCKRCGDAVIKIFSDKFPSLANCLRREFNFLQKAVDEVLKRMDRDSSGRVQR